MSRQPLVRYDAMCQAIAECVAVDEVKSLRDKALALEAYSRQARNVQAEMECAKIRLRAERKCGQILREIEKAKGVGAGGKPGPGRGKKPVAGSNRVSAGSGDDEPLTLAEHGISKSQSSRWQKLAAIPEADFEQHLAGETKPSTAALLRQAAEPDIPKVGSPVPEERRVALKLWGTVRDLNELVGELEPHSLMPLMTDVMTTSMAEWIEPVVPWLQRVQEAIARERGQRADLASTEAGVR